jgi:hypothetical protein
MRATQSDYILRMIEELGAALRRLSERLGRNVDDAATVADEAEALQAELFGTQWPLLRALDAATAASLVADVRQLDLWVRMLRLQAEAEARRGDERGAAALARRADALGAALAARPDPPHRA